VYWDGRYSQQETAAAEVDVLAQMKRGSRRWTRRSGRRQLAPYPHPSLPAYLPPFCIWTRMCCGVRLCARGGVRRASFVRLACLVGEAITKPCFVGQLPPEREREREREERGDAGRLVVVYIIVLIALMKKHTKEIIGYRSAGTPDPFCVPAYQRHEYPHGEQSKLCARSRPVHPRFISAEYHCKPCLERTKKDLQPSLGRPGAGLGCMRASGGLCSPSP